MESFLKKLGETVNKLPDAKAKVKYLEDLLKKEKDRAKRDSIKKLLSYAEEELEKEKKKEQEKKENKKIIRSLEEDLKAPILMDSSEPEKYIVLPTEAEEEPFLGVKEEKKLDTGYAEKKEGSYMKETKKEDISSYVRNIENEAYLEKLEGELWFKGKEESAAIDAASALPLYGTEKESEEYKREEQLKQIVQEDTKRQKEEEYKRKKMIGMM